jgi:hypothetical protein
MLHNQMTDPHKTDTHKTCSEYTWREAQEALTSAFTNKRFTRIEIFDELLEQRFPDLFERYLKVKNFSRNKTTSFLKQLKKEKYPYLFVFKQIKPEHAKIIIPEFDNIIGRITNDGSYQSVLDIYNVMKMMCSDGIKVSKSSLRRWFGIGADSHNAIDRFLQSRGLSYEVLLGRINYYLAKKQEYEEKNDNRALKKLDQEERGYEAALDKKEIKRSGNRAFAERTYLDKQALEQGIIHKKVPIAKMPVQNKSQSTSQPIIIPDALREMTSIKKTKPVNNTTTVTRSPVEDAIRQDPVPATKTSQYTQQTLFGRTVNPQSKKRHIEDPSDEPVRKYSRMG